MAFNGFYRSRKKSEESILLTPNVDSATPITEHQSGGGLGLDTSATAPLLATTSLDSRSIQGHGHQSIVEGASSTFLQGGFSSEPVLSRNVSKDPWDTNTTHLSFLHDEVEKIFEHDWRFDSNNVETYADPNVRSDGASNLEREPSKVALTELYHVDEAEYSRHRRVSYPHTHQPLRSLSNKSLSKSAQKHKHKKQKRKKKRKDKIRSFPSRSAIKSPPIPEEEEHEQFLDDDDESTSTSSESDDDDDGGDFGQTAVYYAILNSSKSAPDVSAPTEEGPQGESVEASVIATSPSVSTVSVDAVGCRPSDFGIQPVGFYIGGENPSPTKESNTALGSSVDRGGEGEEVAGHEEGQERGDGQYIPTEHLAQLSPGQTAVDEDAGSDIQRVQSVAAQKFKHITSQEPESTPMFRTMEEEPLLSPQAQTIVPGMADGTNELSSLQLSHAPSRKLSTGGKVTFVVGDDYTNLNSLHGALDEESSAIMSDDKHEDKENHSKRKKRHSSRHRHKSDSDKESAEGDSEPLSHVLSVEGSHSNHSSSRRRQHHHHHEHFKHEDLIMRRQKGSEIQLDEALHKSPTETEEAATLYKADLDEMASHRFEDQRGIRRHKIARSKGAFQSIVHIGKVHHERRPRVTKKYDHSPHEMFVELDELHVGGEDMWEWREKARWIKFEEDVEEGAERWGRPHVASLSFHSLLELRRGLENGTLLLDLEATDLSTIINSVVENLVIRDLIEEEVKGKLLRTLLLKHRHQQEKGLLSSLSQTNFGSSLGLNRSPSQTSIGKQRRMSKDSKTAAKLDMVKVDVDNNMTDKASDGVPTSASPVEEKKRIQDIMKRIPKGSEASTVLVGQVDFLKKPAMAFVRLAKGQYLDNLTEVPLPVRFVFILIGPETSSMDYHEVGRSLSTLMSNQQFHDVVYRAETREDILRAINAFLDDSIVLPPGDWDHRTLLPITHMARRRAKIRHQKQQQQEKEVLLEKGIKEEVPTDSLQRTGCLFGGLVNDIKRRFPCYLSDITDAGNGQSIAAIFFIFFTCLSPCIAFGGLLSEKTHGLMGVSETMLATSLFGMIFSLFSGQPLLIIGATGPVLVYEETLYKFCESNNMEFLPLRFWIGLWVCVITVVVVALEGSFLVRYVSRFTEEIFAILISLIFIYEVVKKLMMIFSEHPLMESYCNVENGTSLGNFNNSSPNITTTTTSPITIPNTSINSTTNLLSHLAGNVSHTDNGHGQGDSIFGDYNDKSLVREQPNTALMSLILIMGTFLIAYFLRIFRNSKFLGRSVRRALGDFGVLIALVCMVLLSFIMRKTYVQKLDITDPLTPTLSHRGWIINPMGNYIRTPVWIIFASILPAFLIFILLFMETQITEMIMNKKERKFVKGPGYHLDQLLLGILTFMGGIFGLPWMCAATVRTVAHVSALSEYSRTHAPGEKPQLLNVKEQRVTNFSVHLLIGLSTALGPLLREIPVTTLFGVLLYLGVSSMSGVQMFERIKLLLMPVKYHPAVGYVRKVPMSQMHKFTLIQLACLIFLIVIKSTAGALAFPFLLILLVPLRLKVITRFFKPAELDELDNEEEDLELDDEDDPDFYQQAHMPI